LKKYGAGQGRSAILIGNGLAEMTNAVNIQARLPGEDRAMNQFRVIFTRTLTREEIIEAPSLEAARRIADEREKELGINDFATEMTTYDIQEADGEHDDEG
jgi:hypothetical protein